MARCNLGKKAGRKAGFFLALPTLLATLSATLLISGCASTPQSRAIENSPPPIANHYQIDAVPFYPQQDLYCGPTTLAEAFNYYGLELTPNQVAPDLFIPQLKGSLQIEMISASRKRGFVAYAQNGTLEQLLRLIRQDIPVIVLQNLGTSWFPAWHYALAIGYDLERGELILHSGTTQNYSVDFRLFERTWQRASYWLLAVTPPDKTSQNFEAFIYTKSAQDLLDVGQSDAGLKALNSATKEWPDYWLPYFLLGNYFLTQDIHRSVQWYSQGLPYALQQASYLNNYAYALDKTGCREDALQMAEQALELAPEDLNIQDTYEQIIGSGKSGAQATLSCPASK